MSDFDLEKYTEDLILNLLSYAITGKKSGNIDSSVYDLYSETITATINYADKTQVSRVNILSPELTTVCLIMYAINKTVIKMANVNKNALTADPKILGLLSDQFGFDKLGVFGLQEQREVLNRIGDLYQRKGTVVKLEELLQQLKLNNTKIYEYYIREDNLTSDLNLVALNERGDVAREKSYDDITIADNNWFLTNQEVIDILAETNDIVKSPYFSIESELVYSIDSPANYSAAIISSLIRRDLLIKSALPSQYPSIRIIHDPITEFNISFIELVYATSILFALGSGHFLIPTITGTFKTYGYVSTYFTDPNAAFDDVFSPDSGLIDAIAADFASVASLTREVLERRDILNQTAALFYESKFISGMSSNEPTFNSATKLFAIHPTFKTALDFIINDPGAMSHELLYIEYSKLLSSYMSVAYRNSNVTPIFTIDNITDSMLDLIEYVTPAHSTFIGAATVLTFKVFPQDCLPLSQGLYDGTDPTGISFIYFQVEEDVEVEEDVITLIFWDVNDPGDTVNVIDDGFDITYLIALTFEIPLDETSDMHINWEEWEHYVNPVTYDIYGLQYDDFPKFDVRKGLMDYYTMQITGFDFNESVLPISDNITIQLGPLIP